ncbi:cysteine proteinases superfamily protein [Actinidia rufa]|uniref:Cysteine proteinases superfamily protein n=1 Tax=Actinidia rufa TaxID=165716 RepID=A0A7J0GTX3_9ERIC|nr:cysteine proteinases superfamily protein [Actinidia rufa]
MGALTIKRKRSDEYYTFDFKIPCLNSPNLDNRIDTHTFTETKNLFIAESESRSVNFVEKCSFETVSIPGADVMGNVLRFQYDQVKKYAIQSIRCLKKDKEVIDVDEETDRDGVSQDSSIEDVEFVEGESEETSEVVVRDLQELDGKIVERDLQPSSLSVVSNSTNGNLEVGNALETISLERKLELLGLPLHKKLFETAERRNSKLSSLRFEIELNEKRCETLQLLRPVNRPEEEDGTQDVLREPFLPLTEEEEAEVSRAFSNLNRRKVLVTHENSNIEITGEVLQCLRPGKWLNDELFSGRNAYDFKSVRRWTTQRKLGYSLLECDKIFVPIHKEVHWCLAVINKKDQKFQYLDSLGGIDFQVLKVLGCSSLGGCPRFIHYSKNNDAWLSDYLRIKDMKYRVGSHVHLAVHDWRLEMDGLGPESQWWGISVKFISFLVELLESVFPGRSSGVWAAALATTLIVYNLGRNGKMLPNDASSARRRGNGQPPAVTL